MELTRLLKDKETPEGEVTKFLGHWQVRVGNYLTVIIYGVMVFAAIWQLVGWPYASSTTLMNPDGSIGNSPEAAQRPLGEFLVEGDGPNRLVIVLLIALTAVFSVRILLKVTLVVESLHLFAFYRIYKLFVWSINFLPGLYRGENFRGLGKRFVEGVWKTAGG